MRRVTYRDILADAQAVADKYRLGLTQKQFEHLRDTFKSLTRFTRRGVPNPRFVRRFVENLKGFATWSLANGFSLESELELVGPFHVPGTRLEVEREREWIDHRLVFDRDYTLWEEGDPGAPEIRPEHWITDFTELRWVKRDNLARRNEPYRLTAYGQKRMKGRRQRVLLTCFGETKTASSWAKDPRCGVSDKTLIGRKEAGWSDCDAITLHRNAPKPASS